MQMIQKSRMQTEYHSEKFITNIALKLNSKGKLQHAEVTSHQVEKGALLIATNEQREQFFTYTAMVISVGTAILAPLSGLLMTLYLFTFGLNLGLALCMPFWITVFVSSCLDKKVKHCKSEPRLVSFSRKDLFVSILKAGILGTSLVGIMMWLAS